MGSDAQYIKQPSTSDTLQGGAKTVTTAGTRVQLSSTSVPCIDLIVQAKVGNTGRIYIAGSSVANDGSNGIYITAGLSLPLSVINLTQVYIDATVNGEGVSFTYTATVG